MQAVYFVITEDYKTMLHARQPELFMNNRLGLFIGNYIPGIVGAV